MNKLECDRVNKEAIDKEKIFESFLEGPDYENVLEAIFNVVRHAFEQGQQTKEGEQQKD